MSNPLMRLSAGDSSPIETTAILNNFHKRNDGRSPKYRDNLIKNPDSLLNPMGQMNIDTHVDLPEHLEHRISRHFTFKVSGSMEDLANDPKQLMSIPVDENIFRSHSRYQPKASLRSPDLRGDLDQVVILGAKVVAYSNSYPVPLNVEFVNGKSQSEYASLRGNYRVVDSGRRVHFTVPAKSHCGNVNQPINLTSPFIHADYLSRYQGLVSAEALRTKGINRMGDGLSMVSLMHPVMAVINSNHELLGIDEKKVSYGDRPSRTGSPIKVAFVHNDLIDTCLDVLSTDLEQNLPIFDIKGLRMKISRPDMPDSQFSVSNGLEFEPDIALLDEKLNPDNTQKYTQTNTHRSFDLVCNITYAFLSADSVSEDKDHI